MSTSLDKLSDVRSARMYATALMGDLDPSASVKDLVVKAQDSIVIKPNNGLGASLYNRLKILGSTSIDGSLTVDNVTLDGSTVNSSSGNLVLSSNAGGVRVSDVVVSASSMAPSSDVDLTIAGGATKSVLVEGVKFTDNAVTTASGILALSSGGSASNQLRVGGITVTNASASSSTADGNLTLASNGTGALLLDNVKVKTSGITNNVANADLSLTSNGTGSVVIDSVKVKAAGVTTSSGTLSLTSAGSSANRVDVGGLTVTNGSISTASATTVTVAKDLTLTSTAGGSGKVTTSAGNLELTSASGTVAVTGALTASTTITSAGNTVVGGDLKVAGVIDSTNPTGNLEIMDKTVKLGYQSGSATVFDFPFTSSSGGTTPNLSSNAVASMALGGTASVTGGALVIPATSGSHFASTGSFSNTLVNWSTDNFTLEFPVTVTSALTSNQASGCPLVGIENFTPTQLYLRFSVKPSGVMRVDGMARDSDSVGLLDSAGTYLIRLSFAWSGGVCLGTFTYSKNGGATVPITFSGSPTLNVTSALSNCQTGIINLGNTYGLPNQSYSYDYFKLTKGAASTNAASDNSGLFVDGSASYSSRALTWHMGAGETSQDKGDYTGSYWHLEGGQLMLSRTIATADREAPGTNVNLASLASGSDSLRWEFSSSKTSTVGSATFSGTGTVADGVLKESGTQYDSVTPGVTGTFSMMVKVFPQFDLSTLPVLTDLVEYGYVSVQVAAGGFLKFWDGGVGGAIDMTTAMSDQPFSLCVTVDGSTVKLYVDGILVASSTSGNVGPTPQLTLYGGYDYGAIWYDDVRFVSGQALTAANTMLYGWKEMYAANQTVTYGFRISNNEGLQLVKVRGSGGNGWVGSSPSPNTITSGNSMGAIGSNTASVISESQMTY